jgi:parallel beta-helix repeat protein
MSTVLGALQQWFGARRKSSYPRTKARRQTFRPRIDSLEDRRLMAVLYVDDNFAADNPTLRQYTTIQAAVNAAANATGNQVGDTILVRPGLYNESVNVNKKVTLAGTFAPSLPYIGTTLNANDPSLNPGVAAIVDPAAGAGFTLSASGIVVQGFTIANFDGSTDTQGIVVAGALTGSKILSNVIVDNTIGISLATSTATTNDDGLELTYVTNNVLRNNNAAGAASGNGIYADAGIRNVLISGNRITGHANASILIIGATPTTFNTSVQIVGNQIGNAVTGEADSAILLANMVNSSVNSNVLRNIYNNGTGIFFAGGSTNVQVIGNSLVNGAFTGINVRFDPVNYAVATANTRLTIQGNVVQNFGDGGIRLRDGSFNNIVRANTVIGNGFGSSPADVGDGFGSGITLEGAINNIVESNVSQNNDADGIFADAAALGNLLNLNLAIGNGEHDYHDNSVGLGTAGTGNTYTNNRGRTQNRPGLIRIFV